MGALVRLLSLGFSSIFTNARAGARLTATPPPALLLLLLAASAGWMPLNAKADPANERFVLSSPDVLPVGTPFTAGVNITDTNNGYAWTPATLSLSWSGSGTSHSTSPGTTHDYYSGDFEGTATPGNYTVWFTADYSAVTSPPDTNLVSLSATLPIVAVTNVTASTSHIAVGTNRVTLTAQMTPVNAGQHVTWAITNGGGSLSTNQGLTTELICDTAGEFTIKATCGTSSATTIVRVYAVTAVSASPDIVAAGDNVTFTATVEPSGCPLPLTWNISADTGLTVTTNFPASYQTVTATLGDSLASCVSTNVTVQEIKYEVVPNSGNWLPWPAPPFFPKGVSFRVRAVPNPYDPSKPDSEQWPSGKPVWGGEASGTGPIVTVTFGSSSTSVTDLKRVTATCGESKTNTAVVYEFSPRVTPAHNFTGRSTSQFAIGEKFQLAVTNSPGLLPPAVGTWGWSISDEGDSREVGSLSEPSANFGTAKLTGPLLPRSTTLVLWHEPKSLPGLQLSKTTNLVFISPTVTFLKGPGPGGRIGFPEVSGFIDIKVTPDNVSWRLLKVGEVDGQPSLGVGYFAAINSVHQHGVNNFAVRTADGWFVADSDKIAALWLPPEAPAPDPATFAAGSWKWAQIPWFTYAYQGQVVQADYVTASDFDVDLRMVNGQWEISVKKLEIKFARKVNDQTVDIGESRVFQSIPD